jgi:PKD repeat protein
MNSKNKIILSVFSILLILGIYSPLSIAEEDQIIIDGTDDVIYTDAADITGEDQGELKSTSRPNVDIIKMTYIHQDNSKKATLIMQVKGVIKNINDFENPEMDIDDLNFSGTTITYVMELETTYSTYSIEYLNKTCTVNGESASYNVDGSELSITFDLSTINESFVSLIGYTTEFEFKSILDMKIFMDIAPNEALFLASITAPFNGKTGESISFSGEYEDLLDMSIGPYTYTWDWNDGSSDGTGKNPTHTYDLPATYNVELTIEDSAGLTASITHTITITQGSGQNNNNNDGKKDEEAGSGLLLFIGVVAIIVIIGIIALVIVIRR